MAKKWLAAIAPHERMLNALLLASLTDFKRLTHDGAKKMMAARAR